MQAAALPAYTTVPPSPLTQNMVLTDELMSFANVDQTLGASTIQLVCINSHKCLKYMQIYN